MTRPQVCVREWRDTHRPARVVRASGESTSHSGDGVLKPNFVIYSFHVSPASGSEPLVTQAVCLVAEHKVDSAAEAEAKSRQGFAQHFLQLASAFEALNTPFGYVMVNTRYSRVLMLGPGRFAVEAKPGAEAKEQPASPSIVRAIDFLRSGTIFRSLPHDAVDDAAGELEGLQPLWDLVLASLELLFQLPYNKPLPKLPDPASGSVGNTYDQVRSAVERHHQQARIIRPEDVEACGRNDNNGSQDLPRPGPSAGVLNDSAGAKDCRGDYTDASSIQALASLASDVTSSGVGEVPEDRSNSQCLPDNDALDDLLPFDGDAETYEEEYGCTQVIEQLGFSVALVSSTEMDSMIQEYVAFSRIVRTGTTTQDATPV